MEDNTEFQKETVSRLSSIEAQLKILNESCIPCQLRINNANDIAKEALLSAKSAHHRLDDMENSRKELKTDLGNVIDDKIGSINRTARIVSGLTAAFISIVGILLQHFWR